MYNANKYADNISFSKKVTKNGGKRGKDCGHLWIKLFLASIFRVNYQREEEVNRLVSLSVMFLRFLQGVKSLSLMILVLIKIYKKSKDWENPDHCKLKHCSL